MAYKHTNQLVNETSPYLLQHAHNPVNWYPWSNAALDAAKQQDKMILVSIGYSACHWCHVMERESFENEDTAAIMNEHFICIKIDREERPDLDHIYMDAVQAISGSGGWPLNVFLTPQAKPFYGGTYFPPVRAFNRPSWREVLHSLVQSWKQKRNEIETQAQNLTDYISNAANVFTLNKGAVDIPFEKEFDFDDCEKMYNAIIKTADREWGGFGKAPKFPQPFAIQFLLHFYYHTHNKEALQQALLSIDKMLQGGIFDQLGGGLARYSTDEQWLAPHFEKMLYDNALFLLNLCDAYQITQAATYKMAIQKTIAFLQNEMLHPQGGFYAALDADSEGVEGKYYVWDHQEVAAIIGENSSLFSEYFDITAQGNWEGTNILRILQKEDEFIKEKQLDKDTFNKYMADCTTQLLAQRNKRIRPGLDDKIILAWNAIAIKAIAKAAIVLQDEQYSQLATKAYQFLLSRFTLHQNSVAMQHTWKDGKAKYPAFLDDYACLIDASIHLYGLAFDTAYLYKARDLAQYVVEHFSDDSNTFFYYTPLQQDDIIVRKKECYDGATPSGNATMAGNLHTLGVIFDEEDWKIRSENMLRSMANTIIKYPGSFAVWASLFLQKIQGTAEIAVTGKGAVQCSKTIQSGYFIPNAILMATEKEDNSFPILKDKAATDFFQVFICKNYNCSLPVTKLQEVSTLLKNTYNY